MGQQRAGLGLLSGRMMKRALGILSQLMAGRAKEVRCQARLASEGGLRFFETPGHNRDMAYLRVEGLELYEGWGNSIRALGLGQEEGHGSQTGALSSKERSLFLCKGGVALGLALRAGDDRA